MRSSTSIWEKRRRSRISCLGWSLPSPRCSSSCSAAGSFTSRRRDAATSHARGARVPRPGGRRPILLVAPRVDRGHLIEDAGRALPVPASLVARPPYPAELHLPLLEDAVHP